MIAALMAGHLLFPPLAVWAALAAAGPRPEGRIVEMLDFEPVDGALRAQTLRLRRDHSQASDDERAVIVERVGEQLREIPRASWSIDARTPQSYYRFVTMAAPPGGIADKRYWIVVR